MAKRKTHAHRTFSDDSDQVTCECGKKFDTDELWREHYEEQHDEGERAKLEGRDPSAEAEAQRRFDEAHAALIAARDEAAAEEPNGD